MKEPNSNHPLDPLSQGALRHHVVQRLAKAIIRGELPEGTRLVASRLAAQLKVSATPIREALLELEQSGLIELLHHRGALVKPFGRKELRDFYAVRGLLEGEVVRVACHSISRDLMSLLRIDLEQLLGNPDNKDAWVRGALAIDCRVHQILLEHCDNSRLSAEVGRYRILDEIVREVVGYHPAFCQRALVPLVNLLGSIEKQQTDVAVAAMRQHMDIVASMVENVVFDSRPSQAS
jgi:DNA-binding GntR family transcriptional regulator